jgi:hypothetical protein
MQDLFTQALGINSPWFIKDVSFDNKQLNIHIDTNAVTLTTCTNLAIMQESGSDELSLFNPKGMCPSPSHPTILAYFFFTHPSNLLNN